MPPNTKNPSFNLNTNSFPRNAKNYTETIITQSQNHNHNPSFINRAKHTSANPKSQIPNIREGGKSQICKSTFETKLTHAQAISLFIS